MKSEEVRFVWLFVFFDLPVGTKATARATSFRNFLKDDGFMMLQFGLRAGLPGRGWRDKHVARVTRNLPRRGASGASSDRPAVWADEVDARRGHEQRGEAPGSWFCCDSARARRESQQSQVLRRAAYHGEIGREATALIACHATCSRAYHGEIGREATASPRLPSTIAQPTTGKSVGKPRPSAVRGRRSQ